MNIRVKDIPKIDRPIERLIEYGPKILSVEELLAIIIKTGTSKKSSKIIASEILKSIKNINDLKNITLSDLTKINGIGNIKAATILASIELSQRINKNVESIKTKLYNVESVYKYMKNIIPNDKQEHFYTIYLDASKKIIDIKLLFIGTLNYSMVHPREIFKEALLLNTDSIICIHNHPSGSTLPSNADIKLTEKLVKLGRELNLPVIDHLIIGDTYFSFFENNLI